MKHFIAVFLLFAIVSLSPFGLAAADAGGYLPGDIYDDFSVSPIDLSKWWPLEKVRAAPYEGKLISGIRGEASPYGYKNILPFKNANHINTIEADVVYLRGYNAPGVAVGAILEGYFYQAEAGHVYANIGLGKSDYETPRAACRVVDTSDNTKNLHEYFDMEVQEGETYHLKIAYDQATNEFTFSIADHHGHSDSISWTASPRVDPPDKSFKSLTTGIWGPEGTGVSSIFVTFDNVRINNQADLYDDFESSLIDPGKWAKLDRVRAIRDGKLVLSRHMLDGSRETKATINEDNIADATFLGADIAVSDSTFATGNARTTAFMGGFFYNDKPDSADEGAEGNVGAYIGLHYDESGYYMGYKTRRCNNAECSDFTEDKYRFDTPLEPDRTYRLSIEFKDDALFFRCNNEVVKQEILTSFSPPSVKGWTIGVKADGGGDGEAYARAEFDNVAITAPAFDPLKWDLDHDGDVDGVDISMAIQDPYGINPETVREIAAAFGTVEPE